MSSFAMEENESATKPAANAPCDKMPSSRLDENRVIFCSQASNPAIAAATRKMAALKDKGVTAPNATPSSAA